MGLFDIFKRSKEKTDETVPSDAHFLEALKTTIIALGYKAEIQAEKNVLVINGELEITTAIYIPASTHWTLLHMKTVVIHPEYFPTGIAKNIDGIGNTVEKRMHTAIDGYLGNVILPVIECVAGRHNPRFDIFTPDGRSILCHSNPCPIIWHGRWVAYPEGEPVFDTLQGALRIRLASAGIYNWLRVGFSNMDGTANGACEINDEHWQEGFDLIKKYVSDWEKSTDIRAVEQFIIFRRF